MSADTDPIRPAAADAAAAPLDLLLADAATGMQRRKLAERCGEETAAPGELGGGGLEPICDAPGTYVYDH
jgi:hypothetical protein